MQNFARNKTTAEKGQKLKYAGGMASKVVVFAKVATFCELKLKKKLEVHRLGGEVLARGNMSTKLTFRRC